MQKPADIPIPVLPARLPGRWKSMTVALLLTFPAALFADSGSLTPSLGTAAGLAGQQPRLTWPAEPGIVYRIRKSTSLDSSGQGAWSTIAMVQPDGHDGVWVDPEASVQRAFYQVPAPEPEVFSVEAPVLQPFGGELLLRGQYLPAGSSLVLEIEGQAPVSAPLTVVSPGVWRAAVVGGFLPGGAILSARITGGAGVTVCPVNVTFDITATGRALDCPPGLPAAAPAGFAVWPHMHQLSSRVWADEDCDDCDDGDDDSVTSLLMPALMKAKEKANRTKCASNLRLTSGQPTIMNNEKGLLVNFRHCKRNEAELNLNAIGRTGTMRSLPGEVKLEQCDLALPCPAGPALAWVRTYRSKVPVSSAQGAGWDYCYNVSIQPVPVAAGSGASTIIVHDGSGRADSFHRQPDGTFRCDGMYRTLQFSGTVCTMTFADGGTWVFKPLDGSPAAGKISSIADRSSVALTCAYDAGGRLSTVSDSFGRSLSVQWSAAGQVSSVSASTGQKVTYTYGAQDLTSVSCPQVQGSAPVAGDTTYTYTKGNADDRLNHNLLSIRDGEGRLLEGYTYSAVTDPLAVDYDTCSSIDRNQMPAYGHVTVLKFAPVSSPAGGYVVIENDELGRVTETTCNRMHCPVSIREYTGFSTPGVEVTPSSNRPQNKLRLTDPDFFETTCDYNCDRAPSRGTMPDGTQIRIVRERDLRPDCPVLERGNVRVSTLRVPGGEERSVYMENLAGRGTCECTPGWGGGDCREARTGRNPQSGKEIKIAAKKVAKFKAGVELAKSVRTGSGSLPAGKSGTVLNFKNSSHDSLSSRVAGYDLKLLKKVYDDGASAMRRGPGGWDLKENTKFTDDGGMSARTAGYDLKMAIKCFTDEAMSSRAAGGEPDDEDCDGGDDDTAFIRKWSSVMTPGSHHLLQADSVPGASATSGFCTRLVTSYGQVYTWGYDQSGRVTSATTPILGSGYTCTWNSRGQCTSVTAFDGPSSIYRDECVYSAATGFLTDTICDKKLDGTGLQLTMHFERDTMGRVVRVVDEKGNDWLYEYNAASQITRMQTPPTGTSAATASRTSAVYFYDNGGLPVRCDVELRDETGALVAANPALSSFMVYDDRCRLVRLAAEERTLSIPAGLLKPDAASLGSFAVCDFTVDDAGQCVRVSTPAASRAQSTDAVCDCVLDERGFILRSVSGGLGALTSVTTECDYDFLGAMVRCALVGSSAGLPPSASPVSTCSYDKLHRLATCTDPMGNVTTFTYDNYGHVTISVFGEVKDVPGSANNVLLSRKTQQFTATGIFSDGTSCLSTICALQSSNCRSSGGGGGSGGVGNNPAVLARAISTESRVGWRTCTCPAGYFCSVSQDEVFTIERFSPGEADPHPTEVTTVHYSPAGLMQSVTCNGDTQWTMSYDTAGRPVRCSDGACALSVSLDACGNPVSCTRTDSSSLAGVPDKSFTYTFTVDARGRRVSVNGSGAGSARAVAFDSVNRVVQSTEPGGLVFRFDYDGGTPASPFSCRLSADVDGDGSLDMLGTVFCRSGECRSITNSLGYTTTFTRDARSCFSRCDYPDGTSEIATRDAFGNVQQWKCQDECLRVCTFDFNGRVTTCAYTNVPAPVVTMDPLALSYDGLGNCVHAVQGASDITCTYDSCRSKTSEAKNSIGAISRTWSHRGSTGVTYPNGTKFAEARNAQGLLVSLYAVTAAGTVLSPPVSTCDYAGYNLVRESRSDGVVTTWLYRGDGDAALPGAGEDFSFDACVRCTITGPNGVVLDDCVTRRDRNQCVTRVSSVFSAAASPPGRQSVFTLDRLSRVARCVTSRREVAGGQAVTESDVSYTLDAEGNRLTATGGANPGVYTRSDVLPPGDRQMNQYSTWPGGALHWDDNGCLTSMSSGTVQMECVYDAGGRLVSVSDGFSGSPMALYSYDAFGRREGIILFGGSAPAKTTFVYDGDVCVQELGADGLPEMTFAIGAGGVRNCISTRNGSIIYPHGGGAAAAADICKVSPITMRFGKCVGTDSGDFKYRLVAGGTGGVLERFDCDDACRPVFLTSDGIPRASATSALTGFRWLCGDCAWCPESGFYQCSGSVYSPALGQSISVQKDKPKATSKPDRSMWDLATLKKA